MNPVLEYAPYFAAGMSLAVLIFLLTFPLSIALSLIGRDTLRLGGE